MGIKCDVCEFEAKTAQGLAGHKRLSHPQGVEGPGRQVAKLPSPAINHDSDVGNQSVMAAPNGTSEDREGKLVPLEARFGAIDEAMARLEDLLEEKVNNLFGMAATRLLTSAQETASAMLEQRLDSIVRQLDTLESQQGFLVTKAADSERRLGKLEAYVGVRCTTTIPPEGLAELLPRIRRRNTVK